MEVNYYENLFDEFFDFQYNGFTADESFPVERLSIKEREKLTQYHIIEYLFKRSSLPNSKELFEKVLNDEIGKILLENERCNTYLFKTDWWSQVVSKVRSYKGVYDKRKLDSKDVIQKETLLNSKYSYIELLVKVNDETINYLLDNCFFDYQHAFILKSDRDLFSEQGLLEISNLIERNGEWNHVNYLTLMFKYCSEGDLIYRTTSDGSTYQSLQLFEKKPHLSGAAL